MIHFIIIRGGKRCGLGDLQLLDWLAIHPLRTYCVPNADGSTPIGIGPARRLIAEFVKHYNTVCLHSAIGYIITPQDKGHGRDKTIFAASA